MHNSTTHLASASHKKQWIRQQALDLGFADCGFIAVTDPIFTKQMTHLQDWLKKGYEGQLKFMHDNHQLRADPSQLVTGTKTIISVRMDYLTDMPKRGQIKGIADNKRPNHAIIARYARGRDYHKVMRGRLKQLAKRIEDKLSEWSHDTDEPFVFRPFADSAPIFERAIADTAGLGWTGKHSLLINKQAGSFFVLGELFISLDLTEDSTDVKQDVDANQDVEANSDKHCGSCTACIDACPTGAIVEPYTVNANACISYLTIEYDGSIPTQYRKAIGNRVFGCDDCQLVCPWNRYANLTSVDDFAPRNGTEDISLLELWQWSAETFEKNTQGSPIRRTGYVNFLRNIAIAIGNAPANPTNISQLQWRKDWLNSSNPNNLNDSNQPNHALDEQAKQMLIEHIDWAISEQNIALRLGHSLSV